MVFKILELGGRYDLQPAAFWRMTPREFWSYIAGRRTAERFRAKLDLRAAWLTAAWTRAEKLPSLNAALERQLGPEPDAPKVKRKMGPAESRKRMRLAHAAWGFQTKGEA